MNEMTREKVQAMEQVLKMYGITEAEQIVMIQLIQVTHVMGISFKLASKLFPACGAVLDLWENLKDK